MTPRTELILALVAAFLIAIAGLVACHLWGVEGDPCAYQAGPMEAAQCRAQGGPVMVAKAVWR